MMDIVKMEINRDPDVPNTYVWGAVADWRMMDIDKTGYYPEYEGDFEKSTFCLAATGAGYGVRAKLAVQRGCIPIVIADDVQVCTGVHLMRSMFSMYYLCSLRLENGSLLAWRDFPMGLQCCIAYMDACNVLHVSIVSCVWQAAGADTVMLQCILSAITPGFK
jgi:hypothetical protein